MEAIQKGADMFKYAKKRLVLLVFILLMINLLTSCGTALMARDGPEETPEITAEATIEATVEAKEQGMAQEVPTEEPVRFLPADFVFDETIIEDRYYYQTLSEEEKEVYAYLYQEINDLSEEILFRKEIDSIVFHKSYYALLQDCPEFFWLNSNMEITTMDKTGNVTKVAIGFTEVSVAEVEQQRAAVAEVAVEWLAEVDPSLSEYEKVKKVFEIIINHTDYVEGATNNQDIRSVFLGQQSVCSGYAKSMDYLLKKLGITSTIVSGSMGAGVPHCWNLVRIDGNYYWVDVTQGDASGEEGVIYYGYLCFDDAVLNRNYIVEKNIQLSTMPDKITEYFQYPLCNSDEYNFFRQQGRRYDTYDSEVLREYMLDGTADGRSVFAFQFSSEAAFEEAIQALADETLMNEILQTLITREGVQSWQYHYGSDPNIYTIYIQL